MVFLKKASSIGFYSDDKATELEFSKNVVMLTGYNGSGKTSFLVGMYSAINSTYRKNTDMDTSELMNNKNWAIELSILDTDFYEQNKVELAKNYIPKQDLKVIIRYIFLGDSDSSSLNQEKIGKYISSDPIRKSFSDAFTSFKKQIYSNDSSFNIIYSLKYFY